MESGTSGKESTCQCGRHKRHEFSPWVGKIPWRREWHPIVEAIFTLNGAHVAAAVEDITLVAIVEVDGVAGGFEDTLHFISVKHDGIHGVGTSFLACLMVLV